MGSELTQIIRGKRNMLITELLGWDDISLLFLG